jgi:hypothetical protein
MKRPTTTPRPVQSPILGDGIYPKKVFCAALGWEQKTWAHAIQSGLRAISFGRGKIVLGKDAFSFFERMAEQGAGGEGGGNE